MTGQLFTVEKAQFIVNQSSIALQSVEKSWGDFDNSKQIPFSQTAHAAIFGIFIYWTSCYLGEWVGQTYCSELFDNIEYDEEYTRESLFQQVLNVGQQINNNVENAGKMTELLDKIKVVSMTARDFIGLDKTDDNLFIFNFLTANFLGFLKELEDIDNGNFDDQVIKHQDEDVIEEIVSADESLTKYLFVRVRFLENANGKSYYYLCSDWTVGVNDIVLVPTVNEGPKEATVIYRQVYTTRNAPYPLNKTKSVIRIVGRRKEAFDSEISEYSLGPTVKETTGLSQSISTAKATEQKFTQVTSVSIIDTIKNFFTALHWHKNSKAEKNRTTLWKFLAVIICTALLVGIPFGIANHKVYRQVESLKVALENKNNQVKEKDEKILDLETEIALSGYKNSIVKEKADFMDYAVVIAADDGTKTYHKYGCSYLDLDLGYWVYHSEGADYDGYRPCRFCIGT